VRKKTLHKKIGYRNDFGLTFVAARLEQKVDALKAFPSFHNEYAGQNAVRFHSQIYRLQSRRCYCACGGFFSAAGEVIGAPSFEVPSTSLLGTSKHYACSPGQRTLHRQVTPACAPELRAVLCKGVLA
jgi:hypothetical protein